MNTYHIWTMGCQMNAADSTRLASELESLGYWPVARPEDADVVVVNTCVVRQSAEDRAVGRITSLKPLKERKPHMILALMGCLVGLQPAEDLPSRFAHVDLFMPPSDGQPLLDLLRQRQDLLACAPEWPPAAEASGPDAICSDSIGKQAPHDRAAVAVNVPAVLGCNHRCAYCIVPLRRGRERSRPIEEIVSEVEALVARGARQVTLLGQIVDRYGSDLEPGATTSSPDLSDLLRAVHEIDGLWRIRFLTSHPNYLSVRILKAVADLPKVCEHIEVPIQAGDDEILRLMRRGYTVGQYRALVGRIRGLLPQGSIASDVIVGFPGETDAQFQATVDLLTELRLDKVHVAAYSPRPGTWAASHLQDDVPVEVKQLRLAELDGLQEQIVGEINGGLLGRTVPVLVEDLHRGKWRGRTRTDKLVFFRDAGDWRGRLVNVRITWTGPWSMQGEVVADS